MCCFIFQITAVFNVGSTSPRTKKIYWTSDSDAEETYVYNVETIMIYIITVKSRKCAETCLWAQSLRVSILDFAVFFDEDTEQFRFELDVSFDFNLAI